MLDAAVLALRVLSDSDQVHIGVWRLVALDGNTGPNIGIQVEGLPEQQVHGWVSRCDRRLQRSCRGNGDAPLMTFRKKLYTTPWKQTDL